jgi:two-component system phosphate regulon response regulator PhoB
MNKDQILAIEDDEGVCRLLRHSLAREDYQVRIVHSGEEGLEAAFMEPPDLFLLDLELPGMDGLEVCQQLKRNPATRSLPVIILSGKGEEADVVEGLGMGADDYIVKPFSPKILNARVQAVLRRRSEFEAAPADQEVIQLGSLTVDTSSSSVNISGAVVDLSPPEYRFALLLICYASGEKLSRSCPQLAPDENPVSVIGREGMALYSENRLGRLLPVFEALVESGCEAPVLCSFYGLALFESNPVLGKQYLCEAEQKFHDANEPLGELVSLSHLIFFHVVFDGDGRMAQRYLDRAEILNKAYFDRLSVYSRVAVAQNLAIGRSFLLNDFSGSNEYLEIADALAEDRGLVNLVVLNRLVSISEAYVRGNLEQMSVGLEGSLRFGNHPQVSRLHKGLLKLIQLKFFAAKGNFHYLRMQEKGLRESSSPLLEKDNLASLQLVVTIVECLHFESKCDEAFALASETLKREDVIANDLIRPTLIGLQAFSAAISGDSPAAHKAIRECQAESDQMTFRLTQARLYCVRAMALIGEVDEARNILSTIAPLVLEQGWQNLSLQARAQLLLVQEPGTVAADSISTLFAEMQERRVWYLQSLTADDYCRLYELASEAGAAEDYARYMLRQRLQVEVDAEGNLYPLLQMSTLGGIRLAQAGNPVARTEDFSRTQRECLALLAAAPDHRISQEEVQLAFWPDSKPEKARSTLDTMLSRLRGLLKKKLHPYPVKKYLKLQKGVLSLEGVIVDAVEVTNDIARARDLVRRREFWQAEASYAMALSRWEGPFMPGSCNVDQAAVYARQIGQLCIEASLEWSDLLNESGQIRRSIEVLNRALSMDRCNESAMKALYRSHMRDGNIAMAHQLLQEFEDVMRAEGYNPTETARVLASFKSSEKLS